MKKATAALLGAALLLLALSGCARAKLPEGFEKGQVLAWAEEIVTMLNAGDYEGVAARFDDTMSAEMDAEALENAMSGTLSTLGEFKNYKTKAVGEVDGYVVAVMICTYENGSATFTVSLDVDGRICGLYMH